MSEYLAPGVYVEETSVRPKFSIEGGGDQQLVPVSAPPPKGRPVLSRNC